MKINIIITWISQEHQISSIINKIYFLFISYGCHLFITYYNSSKIFGILPSIWQHIMVRVLWPGHLKYWRSANILPNWDTFWFLVQQNVTRSRKFALLKSKHDDLEKQAKITFLSTKSVVNCWFAFYPVPSNSYICGTLNYKLQIYIFQYIRLSKIQAGVWIFKTLIIC